MLEKNKTKYSLWVKVRDKQGNLIPCDLTTDNYRMSFDLDELTDKQIMTLVKSTGKTLKSWMPKDRLITVEAYVLNLFSRTYECLYSWYGDDVDKVVKH